jgi:hypothetical protein
MHIKSFFKYYLPVVIAFCFIGGSCNAAKHNPPVGDQLPATALHPFGRSILDDQGNLQLISSACQFGVSFEGTICSLQVSLPWPNHNYLQYELDGVYQKRIRIDSSNNNPIVITAPAAGNHTLWIYKATEAHTGPIVIHSVSAQNIKALERPAAPLIEFIGNSITCGAASDASLVACGAGDYHDQTNAYMAYGPRVARALGANYIMTCASGIGVYRNWDVDSPTMPQVYEKTDLWPQSPQTWNFSAYTPQIVSIALGTNDFADGDGIHPRQPFDSSAFIQTYIQFIKLIKTKYPNTQIVLLNSAVLPDQKKTMLETCLTSIKKQVDAGNPSAKPVELFFFKPMQARGCLSHPSVEDHAILAGELVPFFKKLLSS